MRSGTGFPEGDLLGVSLVIRGFLRISRQEGGPPAAVLPSLRVGDLTGRSAHPHSTTTCLRSSRGGHEAHDRRWEPSVSGRANIDQCQGKVEMSYSQQSRNVLF